MFQGRIETLSGEIIDFEGQDSTETFLEMFIALENKEIDRIIIKNVRR